MRRKPICKSTDIPVNGIRQYALDGGESVCLLNAGDRFFACQATCPHEGIRLCEGVFDGQLLTCLEHLWQWNLREGGEPRGLAEARLRMYPVECEDGTLYLVVGD